jgi:hypothetical protein
VEDKVKMMSSLICELILEQSIGLNLAKETTFIADEYYGMISNNKLRVDVTTKELNPF